MAKTKRLLSLLLAVAMVLSLMPAIAFAADETWIDWTDATSLPSTTGNYKLTTTVTVDTPIVLPTDEDATIVIDLNGQTVNSNVATYLYEANTAADYTTTLNITGEGTVNLPVGRFAYIHGAGKSTLNIQGGTFNGGTVTGNGGVLMVADGNNTIRVSGGVINGGTVTGNGGVVQAHTNGNFAMTGGIINGGTAALGGAVIIEGDNDTASANFTMTGGLITGGNATANGGNVVVRNKGKFTMVGGSITDGKATTASNGRGGNVFVHIGTFDISGSAKISGGTCAASQTSPNVHLNDDQAVFTAFFKGDGYIGGNSYGTNGINRALHIACECGSKTGKHLPDCPGVKHTNWYGWTSATLLPRDNTLIENGHFYLTKNIDISESRTFVNNQNLYIDLNGFNITSDGKRVFNMASADTNVNVTISDSRDSSVVKVTNYADGGSFTVVGSTGTKSLTIYGGTYDMSEISATANGGFIRVGGAGAQDTFNFHGGTIIGAAAANAGGAVWVGNDAQSTFNMTGGTIKNGKANNGGNVAVLAGTFNMSGGKIIDGSAVAASNGRGGNVFVNASTFNMSGDAKIYGGSDTNGTSQNVWLATSTFTAALTGDGAVDGGISTNPRIACGCGSKTSEHLPDCPGVKHNNWYAWDKTVMPSSNYFADTNNPVSYYYLTKDIEVGESRAVSAGQTIYLDLNGHKITNTAASDRLWQLNASNSKAVILDSVGGGLIDLGTTNYGGSLIALGGPTTTGCEFVLYGGTIDGSKTSGAQTAGVIRNAVNATTKIYGGEIIGGSVTAYGAAIYNSGNMIIAGGKIHGGTAGGEGTGAGGNIYTDDGVITMTDGEIYGGTANKGGNVFVGSRKENAGTENEVEYHATFNMEGGKIYDGTANYGANVYVDKETTFNMAGGEVYITDGEDGVYPPELTTCICGNPESHLPGCDEVVTDEWTPLYSSTTAMPTETGKYYLIEDLDISEVVELSANAEISIDLNGHTITSTATRIWKATTADTAGKVTISDSAGGGKIVLGNENKEVGFGALVSLITGDWDFYLYGGEIDGTYTTASGERYGAVIHTRNDAVDVYICGGTIIGSVSENTDNLGGGAIGINMGHLYMSGGTITGGEVSDSGGNVRIGGEGSSFVMTGGTITGGTANKGGNVYLTELAEYSNEGGTITGGTSLVYAEKGDVYREFYLNVVWMNGETVHQENSWPYYKTIVLPTAPTKEADAEFAYEFAGWDATGDGVVDDIAGTKLVGKEGETVTYTAVYNAVPRKYTVTWVDEDGTVLEIDENVEYGATPEFNGETPTKEADENYTYTFDTWTPTVDVVTSDVTYTATYTAEQIKPEVQLGTIEHASVTLQLENVVYITLKVRYAGWAEDFDYANNMGVLIWEGAEEDYAPELLVVGNPNVGVYPYEAYFEANSKGDRWVVNTPGIPAAELYKMQYMRVYVDGGDGNYAYAEPQYYGARRYAVYAFAKLNDNFAAAKKTVAAMLNYGAAAQLYFAEVNKTEVGELANVITEEFAREVYPNYTDAEIAKAVSGIADFTVAYEDNMMEECGTVNEDIVGEFVRDNSICTSRTRTLLLEGNILMNYRCKFNLSNISTVKAMYWTADQVAELAEKGEVMSEANATKVVDAQPDGDRYMDLYGFAAKDLDDTLYSTMVVTTTDGKVYSSGIMASSPYLYLQGKVGTADTLGDVCRALTVYGAMAKSYFPQS